MYTTYGHLVLHKLPCYTKTINIPTSKRGILLLLVMN